MLLRSFFHVRYDLVCEDEYEDLDLELEEADEEEVMGGGRATFDAVMRRFLS